MNSDNINITYEGKVKVSLYKKDKLKSTKIYKNQGRWPLFTFLTNCLKGDYKNIELYRPKFIVLYSIPRTYLNDRKEIPDLIPEINDKSGVKGQNTDIAYYTLPEFKKNSVIISLDSSPKIVTDSDGIIGYSSITYTFKIPFTQLSLQKELGVDSWNAEPYSYTWNPINLVALYSGEYIPNNNLANYSQPSAFFFPAWINKKGEVTKILGSLIGANEATDNSSEYSLSIEWTLTLGNK